MATIDNKLFTNIDPTFDYLFTIQVIFLPLIKTTTIPEYVRLPSSLFKIVNRRYFSQHLSLEGKISSKETVGNVTFLIFLLCGIFQSTTP